MFRLLCEDRRLVVLRQDVNGSGLAWLGIEDA
jgi:hypothetical protein